MRLLDCGHLLSDVAGGDAHETRGLRPAELVGSPKGIHDAGRVRCALCGRERLPELWGALGSVEGQGVGSTAASRAASSNCWGDL
jgi:hypothetical protein